MDYKNMDYKDIQNLTQEQIRGIEPLKSMRTTEDAKTYCIPSQQAEYVKTVCKKAGIESSCIICGKTLDGDSTAEGTRLTKELIEKGLCDEAELRFIPKNLSKLVVPLEWNDILALLECKMDKEHILTRIDREACMPSGQIWTNEEMDRYLP